jgi:hypothetical protein
MKVQKSTYKGQNKKFLSHDTIKIKEIMKSSQIFGAIIVLLMIVIGVLILSAFNQPAASAWHAQVTSTPITEDKSVVGSTDGIVALGFLIVLIVTVPLLFRRKKK